MRRSALFLVFAIGLLLPASAQKELKTLRSYVKNGKTGDAIKEAERLAADSTWRMEPNVYAAKFQAHKQVYLAQNEKMYLKQKADTTAYFSAIHDMFVSALQCDSAERYQMKEKKRKMRHRSVHTSQLSSLLPNLLSGAGYFYSHGLYAQAGTTSSLLLNLEKDTLFWDHATMPQIQPLQRQLTALIHVQSHYQTKQYREMFLHSDEALKYAPAWGEVMEELAVGHLQLGDTTAYCKMLEEALDSLPARQTLYDRLRLIYYQDNAHEKLLSAARHVQSADSLRLDCRRDELVALYNLERYDELLGSAPTLLALSPEDPIGHYYAGMCYVAKAKAVPVPVKRSATQSYKKLVAQRKGFYKQARGPLETYRRLCPDKASHWAPPLYDIYLNLNLGKEFEEISKNVIK